MQEYKILFKTFVKLANSKKKLGASRYILEERKEEPKNTFIFLYSTHTHNNYSAYAQVVAKNLNASFKTVEQERKIRQ